MFPNVVICEECQLDGDGLIWAMKCALCPALCFLLAAPDTPFTLSVCISFSRTQVVDLTLSLLFLVPFVPLLLTPK